LTRATFEYLCLKMMGWWLSRTASYFERECWCSASEHYIMSNICFNWIYIVGIFVLCPILCSRQEKEWLA
jgi:hypothetical protein